MKVEPDFEKRVCLRFRVPGATVKYKKQKAFLKKTDFVAEFCPVLDLSRGGIRFLATELLKFDSEVALMVSIPGEAEFLTLIGIVRWYTLNPGQSYKYQIGVQLNPYGKKKGQNDPAALAKMLELEKKFLDEAERSDDGSRGKA
jgi:Tfp pilus assembly protein PilZ